MVEIHVMKTYMKLGVALVALQCVGVALAGGEGWTSDFAAAKKEAVASKKDLLMDFTGSDWCGWCIKLKEEVFSKEAFKIGVKDKFVLVEVDFPKDKSKLSEATIKQNDELGKKYQIQGYPTILLCDADGKPFAATGYEKGGPEAYVKHLNELRTKKATRDESLQSAAKVTGLEKAKLLVAALKGMELEDTLLVSFYSNVIEDIKAADPKDETGFGKAAAAKGRIAKFQEELSAIAQKQDFDGALALVDKTLKEGGFPPDETQQLMATRAMIFVQQKKFDEAIKAVDEAKAFSPASKIGASLEGFKQHLLDQKMKAAQEGKPAQPEAK